MLKASFRLNFCNYQQMLHCTVFNSFLAIKLCHFQDFFYINSTEKITRSDIWWAWKLRNLFSTMFSWNFLQKVRLNEKVNCHGKSVTNWITYFCSCLWSNASWKQLILINRNVCDLMNHTIDVQHSCKQCKQPTLWFWYACGILLRVTMLKDIYSVLISA